MYISAEQESDVKQISSMFPDVFKKAIIDWAKFKAGQEKNLFTAGQVQTIVEWFAGFPKLWSGIRNNYVAFSSSLVDGREVTRERPTEFARSADNFARKLGGDILIKNALGIAPLIIAGIIIAAAFGTAGITWGIGYIKKQNNISQIIDQVTAGKIPADVLVSAIEAEERSLFGDIGDVFKYLAIGAGLIFVVPPLITYMKKSK